MLNSILGGTRLVMRRLRRSLVFTTSTVAMLALTFAALVLVLGVVYAAKLRPLPMRDAGRLATIWQNDRRAAIPKQDVVPGDVVAAWRSRQTSFSDIAASYSLRCKER